MHADAILDTAAGVFLAAMVIGLAYWMVTGREPMTAEEAYEHGKEHGLWGCLPSTAPFLLAIGVVAFVIWRLFR